jgi:hypothetical protein
VKSSNKFIGDSVMSGCRRIVEIVDNFVDFTSSNCVIVGDWAVVSFHKVW